MNSTGAPPAVKVVDVQEERKTYIPPTHWGLPYDSNLLQQNPDLPRHLLEHVSCTYLSTSGRPPTLLALKQHAQSLTYLISRLAPSETMGQIDDSEETKKKDLLFVKHQCFDWLNDLQQHYQNDDEAHQAPLNALRNLVKSNSNVRGPQYHCPADTELDYPEKHPQTSLRPFETHMNLLMHANECLERLDHEYSAMGGLLSIIPLDNEQVGEKADLTMAKKTLIGQWILFTQHFINRLHEIEVAYANCLDLLANEAVVPSQHISVHGPDGRSGREIVFPQDRWILANAGEDVFTFVHGLLDRKEAFLERSDAEFSVQGAIGGALRTDDEKIRGIVKVDLHTRFYRIKDSGHGPIFVLPAFGDRPNTEYTREIENRPTVVTVPTPAYPVRTSVWDEKNHDMEKRHMEQSLEIMQLSSKLRTAENDRDFLDHQVKRLRIIEASCVKVHGQDPKKLSDQIATLEMEKDQLREELEQCHADEQVLREELDVHKQHNTASQQSMFLPTGVLETPTEGYTSMSSESYQSEHTPKLKVAQAAFEGINRTKGIISSLIDQGQLDEADFKWMDDVADLGYATSVSQ